MHELSFYQAKLTHLKSLLPGQTKLLIVSKTRSVEEIKMYYHLGHRDFGENRVQELREKALKLEKECPEIRWHMIGHLQTNKVKQLLSIKNLVSIHSVSNEKLLSEILSFDKKLTFSVGIFLQINTSFEEEKSGFETKDEILSLLNRFENLDHLFLQGLMTMGKLRTDDFKKAAKECFGLLNEFKDLCEKKINHPLESSMGMSQDYEIALEEGSHWIRLGTTMFE
jgi:PLP dependent protein